MKLITHAAGEITAPRKKGAVVEVAPDQARARHIAETLGATELLREDQYPALARTIHTVLSSGYEHPHDSDYTQVSQATWMNNFSNDRDAAEAVKTELFDTLNSYQSSGHSKGYKLKLPLRAKLDATERNYNHVSDSEARPIPRHGQRPGRSSVSLPNIPNFIHVDQEAIANVLTALAPTVDALGTGGDVQDVPTILQHETENLTIEKRGNIEAVVQYLNDTRIHLNDVVALAANPVNRGMLPQAFKPSTSGRWEGADFNLQKVHSLARRVALAGHYSYDISSCYQSIANQLCLQRGLTLDGLSFYINNKHSVRKDLAGHIDITEGAIKEVLIALGYGASEHGGAMRCLLTTNQRRKLQKHPIFRQLANDMDVALEHIADTSEVTANGSKIRNVLGYCRDLHTGQAEQRTRISDSKIAAHICFGYESAALMAMAEVAHTPVLTVHDCLVCQRPEDIKKLEAAMLNKTGLELRLDPEPEVYPLWH